MAQRQGYGQFCPVAMGAEVFATRWTPLVLREMMSGSSRFNEIQKGVPLMSRSLLSQRLQELEHSGMVERRRDPDGAGASYVLTPAGEALRPVVMMLGEWAHRWLQQTIPERNLDPALLMWDVRRTVDPERFPSPARTIVQFVFDGVPASRRLWWLVVERGTVDLCFRRPAPENDLEVTSRIDDLTNVWLGHLRLEPALASGRVRLAGALAQRDAFRHWFALSYYARESRDAA